MKQQFHRSTVYRSSAAQAAIHGSVTSLLSDPGMLSQVRGLTTDERRCALERLFRINRERDYWQPEATEHNDHSSESQDQR